MNALLFKLLMTLIIRVCQHLRDNYKAMTPEQRLEWNRQRSNEWVKDFQVDEGDLPEGPGIVLEDAIDPKEHVDDKVGE